MFHYIVHLFHYFCSRGVSSARCLHTVSLLEYYPCGVGTVEYHLQLDVLIVAGLVEPKQGGRLIESIIPLVPQTIH